MLWLIVFLPFLVLWYLGIHTNTICVQTARLDRVSNLWTVEESGNDAELHVVLYMYTYDVSIVSQANTAGS